MSSLSAWCGTFVWLIHKDIVRELRARRILPVTLLLGISLILLLALRLDIALDARLHVSGGLFWAASFFAGALLVERSFAAEREEGCWRAMRLMPITPATIYLAKLAFHFLALLGLQLVILPCFALLADVSWMANPGKLAAVVVLANLGFASIGTILGGMLCSLRQRSQMLMILLLPLVVPVALGAGAATTALADAQPDPEWLLGLQLLGLFAGLYAAAGALLFEYAMEE